MRVLDSKSEYENGQIFAGMGAVQMSANRLALQLDQLIQDLDVGG